MAKTLKVRVSYLLAELFAHAKIFLLFCQAAGTKALLAAKTLSNFIANFLIGVEINLHFATSLLKYFNTFLV